MTGGIPSELVSWRPYKERTKHLSEWLTLCGSVGNPYNCNYYELLHKRNAKNATQRDKIDRRSVDRVVDFVLSISAHSGATSAQDQP